MPLSDIVQVNVSTQSPGVTRAGFGVPLILSQTASWTEHSRSYTSLTGVAADFPAGTPEYSAASKVFSQNPRPAKLRIGRASTNPVSQRWAVGVITAAVGVVYKLYVALADGTKQAVSHTALAAAAWQTSHTYAAGDLVTNDSGKLYVCTTGGTSAGSGGPTGSGGTAITDNTVTWYYAGAGSAGAASSDAIVENLLLGVNALYPAWQTGHAYAVGDQVTNDTGKWYVCTIAGTSAGSGGPTGRSAAITDNTVTWAYVSDGTTQSLQGSAGSKTLRVLANASSVWVAVEIDDPNRLSLAQDHAAPTSSGLATDLAAIAAETTDWYGLITLYNSSAYVAAAAAWCESNTKLYAAAVNDTACATAAYTGASDIGHTLKATGYARTAPFFHPRAADFADAGEMGRFFPIAPGGDNWRLKTLVGVTSGWGNGTQYTSTHVTNLTARNMNFYYDLAGLSVIGGEGMVAAGEYVDVVRGIDWWSARTQERLANLLIQNEKVPFTDKGIALVEAEVEAQNDEGVRAGLINPGSPPGIPAPSVTVPTSGSVSPSDRAARTLNNVNSQWVVAGAINHLVVNATVTQ